MTGREWKPGDVAIRVSRYRHHPNQVSMLVPKCSAETHDPGPHWHHSRGGWDSLDGSSTYRPLVILDPESDEDVARLCAAYKSVDHSVGTIPMQAALREFADPKPPRPEEPTATGSIVHDHDGEAWVRYARGEWSCLHSRPGKDVRTWAELVDQYGPIEVPA